MEPTIEKTSRCTTCPDDIIDLPAAPQQFDLCNPENVTNNVYWGSTTDTDMYYWTLNNDGSLTVTTKTGYTFANGTSHTYYLNDDNGVNCVIELETPKPKQVVVCGPENDEFKYEGGDHYTVSSEWNENKFIITYTADTGYVFAVNGTNTYTKTFRDEILHAKNHNLPMSPVTQTVAFQLNV